VGGVVRDALLGRKGDYLDLDFVLPSQAVETAQAVAKQYDAGFVILDAARQIARVVFDEATVDFALQEGPNLEMDLQRRDFTINAIAYNPHTQTLIDPLGGAQDLGARRLRMVTAANLADDPLRLLRAYRQAAQLNFSLDPLTEQTITQLAPHLQQVAPERVQAELNYLLANENGGPWLGAALRSTLLQPWLPSATDDNVQQVNKLQTLATQLVQRWPALASHFYHPLALTQKEGYKRTGLALAKLTALLATDPHQAETEWCCLKGSRAEMRAIQLFKRLQPTLARPQSVREQYHLFRETQQLFPILLLLSWAAIDDGNLQHSVTNPTTNPTINSELPFDDNLQELLHRFLDPNDRVAHPQPLLDGKTLMLSLSLKPGPQVGHLLTELQVAQAEGAIHTTAEAITWARQAVEQARQTQEAHQTQDARSVQLDSEQTPH
jgi:tRNA nucleotidyltransferase (CCA-adding enzyme)